MRGLYWLWTGWYYLCAALGFILIILPLAIVLFIVGGGRWHPSWLHFLRRVWAVLTGLGTGIRVRVLAHPEFLKIYRLQRQPVIFCPTHRSYLDIHALLEGLPGRVSFVAKHELVRNPVFAWFLRNLDVVVRRGTPQAGRALRQQARTRLQQGWSLVIFPEGTSHLTPYLQTLKPGAFILAKETSTPIVPIRMWNTLCRMPDQGQYGGQPGEILVYIDAPLFPNEYPSWQALQEAVRCRLNPRPPHLEECLRRFRIPIPRT